jgi:hypothetical protein
LALVAPLVAPEDAAIAIKEISRALYEHFSRVARATAQGAYVEKPLSN